MNLNHHLLSLHYPMPEDICRCKERGDLEQAERMIDLQLEKELLPAALRAKYLAEKEILHRIAGEYPYDHGQAMELLRELIPDFTEEEFQQRIDRGVVRWIYLNGEPHYIEGFTATLIKTEPEFARRAGKLPDTAAARAGAGNPLDRCVQIMKEKGSMSCRIRARQTIRMAEQDFTPGMELEAWLPVPAACEAQSEIRVERTWPEGAVVAEENVPARTVYWKRKAEENTEFGVEYSYVRTQKYQDFTVPGEPDPQAGQYLGEQVPHIVFTPYLRALAEEITAGEETALGKARAIYDYMTTTMKYTYMPMYFVLEDIAQNCALNHTGDCGVFALTFITLCRICGIPAVWESGNEAEPDELGSHDWARFYTEPWGWAYADVSFGISSHRVGNEERRRFYFGNLEPYRMAANRQFQPELTPPMTGWRNDPYDNQSGELQADGVGMQQHQVVKTRGILSHEEL